MISLDETQIGQSALLNEMICRLNTLKELDLIEKLNPSFTKDGNKFCYLYGENLQDGIAGFGETAAEAMSQFYNAFWNEKIKTLKQ
tara:strand:- start:191 stop:448 length:258 start_codon:yes stop_codon:yes gene_type:complete